MIQLICFFTPAFLAAELFEAKQNRQLTAREFITAYIIFVGIINFLCLSIVALIFHHPDYIMNQNVFTIGFSFKYLLLSFFLAMILPYIYEKTKPAIPKCRDIFRERRASRR